MMGKYGSWGAEWRVDLGEGFGVATGKKPMRNVSFADFSFASLFVLFQLISQINPYYINLNRLVRQ